MLSGNSIVTIPVGLWAKSFVKLCCKRVQVHGMAKLLSSIDDPNVGLLTVSNHISVMDDPFMWGVLPLRSFIYPKTHLRYTLGASDICYTNKFNSTFFNAGQTIETFRGQGIYQPAVDRAIELLGQGKWVHIFPEGKVNQHPNLDPQNSTSDVDTSKMTNEELKIFNNKKSEAISNFDLIRFKWGISRILIEAMSNLNSQKSLRILPIWISGFDQVMPANRKSPRFIPRIGADLSIHIGDPIEEKFTKFSSLPKSTTLTLDKSGNRPSPPLYEGDSPDLLKARIDIASILRDELRKLAPNSSHTTM